MPQENTAVDAGRAPPQRAPEVHLVGEVRHGTGFGPGASCKWRLDHGKHWGVLEGSVDGHTQTSYGPEGGAAVWNHPLDVHYQTASLQGWPRLVVQIQQLDRLGRVSVVAHGFAHVPCTPGAHRVVLPCWRATGTQEEELRAFFLDEYPVLLDEDLVFHKAPAQRHRLVTVPSGTVTVEVSVLLRHFGDYGYDLAA